MMDELTSLMSVPDHPLLHILSFLNYSDLAAYVRYFIIKLGLLSKVPVSDTWLDCPMMLSMRFHVDNVRVR